MFKINLNSRDVAFKLQGVLRMQELSRFSPAKFVEKVSGPFILIIPIFYFKFIILKTSSKGY